MRILLAILFLTPSICLADNVYKINTGYAYVVRGGKAIGKIELRKGAEYHLPDTDTLVEVQNISDLTFVNVVKTQEQVDAEAERAARKEFRRTLKAKLQGLGLTKEEIKELVND